MTCSRYAILGNAHHRYTVSRLQIIDDATLEFEAIGATSELCEDGIALDMAGGDISRLDSGNAPLLWTHDAHTILGRVKSAWKSSSKLYYVGRFSSPGISAFADEKRKLLKDGIICNSSMTFTVKESKKIAGGIRATKWIGYEMSLCAVPVDPGAVILKRGIVARGIVMPGVSQSRAKEKTFDPASLREDVRRLGEIGARHAREFGYDDVEPATLEQDVRRLGEIGKQYARELDYLRGNSRAPHEAAPVRGPQIGRARTSWGNQ